VLKDSRGGEVARGTAQLGFKATGPAGYCGFDPVPGSDIRVPELLEQLPRRVRRAVQLVSLLHDLKSPA
jgi:hypothetical protein